MVPIRFQPAKLKSTQPSEYLWRFLFGCAVTLLAGLIGKWAGPVVGGIFLAFPGIFPPGISFVEKEQQQKAQKAGVQGQGQARAVSSIHAAGTSAGALALITFALVVWRALGHLKPIETLLLATLAWFAVSFAAWWLRERL